jgi:uncharacterized membrane protein
MRVLGAFLAVFCLLCWLVNSWDLTIVFGGMSVALFALDLALNYLLRAPRSIRIREKLL